MELQKTNYKNDTLKVEINCYIDKKNEIWFRGKEIALILEYKNTCKAIIDHVHKDDKKIMVCKIKPKARGNKTLPLDESPETGGNKTLPLAEDLEKAIECLFINESGFYSLILSYKQPKAREFKHWVTSKVLPSIRKKGYYDTKSKKLLIESEYDLHCKVVSFIRDKYCEALMIAGLGENQCFRMQKEVDLDFTQMRRKNNEKPIICCINLGTVTCNNGKNYTLAGKHCHLKTKKHFENVMPHNECFIDK